MFLWNFLSSIDPHCGAGDNRTESNLPPVYLVAGDIDDYSVTQVREMRRFCQVTGGDLYSADTATWEAGAIQVLNRKLPPEVTEFVFFQDTFEFKPGQFVPFWERIVATNQKTIWFTHNCQMYAGKFRREVLDKMQPWPWPKSKTQAVGMERSWQENYNGAEDDWSVYKWAGIPDGVEEIIKCGRLNVRCENEYFIKWKGTHTGNLQRRLHEIDEEGKL